MFDRTRNWLASRLATKASSAGGAIAAYSVGQPVWTPRRYDSLAEETYLRNAVSFRCVKMIAQGAATAPWLLYSGDREVDDHPLLSLLNRPAPTVAGHKLFEALYAYLLLAGNSYLEAVAPHSGPPRELWNLRPDRMRVIPGADGIPAAYEYDAMGRKVRWEVDPVRGRSPILHLAEFHPLNDWYGLSRVEPGAYAVDRHNAAGAHNKALLDNGARPSGALVFKPVKSSDGGEKSAPMEVIEAAEDRLMDRHQGAANAGRPMVLGGNVAWEQMGVTPKDMDFNEGKLDAARDICLAFGVPHILIVPGESTYNNVREAKLELWEETILPLIDMGLDELNNWLVPMFGDRLRLDIDKDEIPALELRRESKRKSILEVHEAGIIDANEAREALQYGKRDKEAVGKVDAQVLTSLINAVRQGDDSMFAPLFRYLRSVGLVEPDETLDSFIASWSTRQFEIDPETAGALPDGGAAGPTPEEEGGANDQS